MSVSRELSPEALGAIVDASAAINSALGLDETLAAIARAAAAVMRAEAASVIMFDDIRRRQVFRAAVGDRADRILGMEFEEGVGISGLVLKSGRARIVHNVADEKSHYKGIDLSSGFHTRSLLAAPLVNKDRTLGVVEVLNPLTADRFDADDLALCQVFANLAAIAVANAQLYDRLQKENSGLKRVLRRPDQIIGVSPAIRKATDLIARAARTAVTALLLGETGTGKELAARMIHALSDRSERVFMAINCAAIPETLMESELFGHEAGAFTGATHRKLGYFELADGGTIFLDEIAEMVPAAQAKLLRVLEAKEVIRLGGTQAVGCDVRIIAATNRDLAAEMRAGRFRKDLYYRLNVFPVRMPPLRERREDIPVLVEHFVRQSASDLKMPAPSVSPEAVAALMAYDFSGNVRELQNLVERACLLCAGSEDAGQTPAQIRPEHLSCEIAPAAAQVTDGRSALEAYEKAMILSALRECNWNQTKAGRALGMSRDNLRYRVRKYGIVRPD
ncbi:MAG: sigma 54-interacting transcriptional regulator [Planctomycetota bacterium]|nr:sigma 54-interacting transcriptional regulator [Planctomycetota bacterium]